MRFHRFAVRMTVMLAMAVFLLSVFAPAVCAYEIWEEQAGTVEYETDEDGELITDELPTDEDGEVITTEELPPYIIVENTTADPFAPTEAPTEPSTEPPVFAEVTDEYGDTVTDENGEAVTEIVTEAPLTDENGEVITTEPPTEAPTEPYVPDALNENGLLLTIASRNADYGYRIVIPKDSSDETGYAAGLLQITVQKMTGVLLPIVSDAAAKQDREICIGVTNRTTKKPAGVSDNGFYLHVQDERVFLYALGEQGAIYAVNAFLHECGNCRWFSGDETQIPVVDDLQVPTNLSLQRGIYFSYTETFSALTDADFLQMNSLTGGAYTFVSDDGSVTRTYLTDCEETLGTRFVSADTYFESHPEYFALYNNQRHPSQLCLSNWDVYSVVLQELDSILRAEWSPKQKKQVICLTLPDNEVVCQCAQCSMLSAQNGSYAGVLITFLNRVSAGLYAAGYSNLQLETIARGSTFVVPTAVVPANNITVRVSASCRCSAHALSNANCAYNRYFTDMLRVWVQCMPTVYVDLPTENTAHTLGIFADMKHLQSDVQTLYYLGADGICAADDPFAADCGPELRALRMYLLTCLFADPYCDLADERRAFLKSWYGEGYAQWELILDILCDNAGDADGHLFVNTPIENTLSLTLSEVDRINSLWDAAMQLCNDGRQQMHNEQSRLAWRFWQACCGVGEFNEEAETDVTQRLIDDLQTAGICRYSVDNATLNLSFLSRTLRPQEWNTPALELLKPHLQRVRKLLTVVVVLALLVLAVFAVLRKRLLFVLPAWAFIVTAAVMPWHTESCEASAWGSILLSGSVLIAFLALLCALAVYAKYSSGKETDLLHLFRKKSNEAQPETQSAENNTDENNTENMFEDNNRAAWRKRTILFAAVGAITAAVPYFVVLSLPSFVSVTGAQITPLAVLLPCLHAAVSSCLLTVRFIRNGK